MFMFFHFSFWATLSFTFMNALFYADKDQGIHKGKTQSCSKWKTKKTTWVFFFYKHSKFWSVSLGQKVERKPVFSEECISISIYIVHIQKHMQMYTIPRWDQHCQWHQNILFLLLLVICTRCQINLNREERCILAT